MSKNRDLANLLADGSTVTTADMSADTVTSLKSGRKNLIINGAMQVAQRGTQVTGVTVGGYKSLDRHVVDLNSAGTWTISQDTNTPSGFGSSMKFLCTTADASLGGADRIAFRQLIEGQNLQQLAKGTSSAKQATASFWVKSNKTGTYVLELYDLDNSRHINKSYTINSSDTWEYKTITFDADLVGALDNDNASSAMLHFWLGTGSNYNTGTLQTSWDANASANRAVGNVNLADTVNNYWQVTGIQLELGDTATDFEHRSYGEELALCQRYYWKRTFEDDAYQHIKIGMVLGTSYCSTNFEHPTQMRTSPTMLFAPVSSFRVNDARGNDQTCSSISTVNPKPDYVRLDFYKATANLTIGYCAYINRELNSSPCWMAADAEL